eukprot:4612662-Prymnesium_polylepis.1
MLASLQCRIRLRSTRGALETDSRVGTLSTSAEIHPGAHRARPPRPARAVKCIRLARGRASSQRSSRTRTCSRRSLCTGASASPSSRNTLARRGGPLPARARRWAPTSPRLKCCSGAGPGAAGTSSPSRH